jgi:hypothetical protein
VAAVQELTVEVVSVIMNLDIIQVAQQQLDAEDVPAAADESAAEAVPVGEEMPAAVEVGKQSAVTTRYASLTNCNIR